MLSLRISPTKHLKVSCVRENSFIQSSLTSINNISKSMTINFKKKWMKSKNGMFNLTFCVCEYIFIYFLFSGQFFFLNSLHMPTFRLINVKEFLINFRIIHCVIFYTNSSYIKGTAIRCLI